MLVLLDLYPQTSAARIRIMERIIVGNRIERTRRSVIGTWNTVERRYDSLSLG